MNMIQGVIFKKCGKLQFSCLSMRRILIKSGGDLQIKLQRGERKITESEFLS